MNNLQFIEINADTDVPKYKQLVNAVISGIEEGVWKIGDRIPSINKISQEYELSRSTVEKAYINLRNQKIIKPIKGKGFYVAKTDLRTRTDILFVLDRIRPYNINLLNAFTEVFETTVKIDIETYNGDLTAFNDAINTKKNLYDYLVIFPRFKEGISCTNNSREEELVTLDKVLLQKLILMDRKNKKFLGRINQIYQDFDDNFFRVLNKEATNMAKYKKLTLILPKNNPYPRPIEVAKGLKKFCIKHQLAYDIKDELHSSTSLETNVLYIAFKESDLIHIVNKTKKENYKIGEDIGVISYMDTMLKKYLGISVIETNFQKITKAISNILSQGTINTVRVDFDFINRNSA